jgi:hypothetical protein
MGQSDGTLPLTPDTGTSVYGSGGYVPPDIYAPPALTSTYNYPSLTDPNAAPAGMVPASANYGVTASGGASLIPGTQFISANAPVTALVAPATAGLSSNTLLMIGAGALALLLISSGGRKRR